MSLEITLTVPLSRNVYHSNKTIIFGGSRSKFILTQDWIVTFDIEKNIASWTKDSQEISFIVNNNMKTKQDLYNVPKKFG